MSKMPVDVKKILKVISHVGKERGQSVYLDLVFDPTASQRLVDAVLGAFVEVESKAYVETVVLGATVPEVPLPADLCVIVGGDSLLLGDVAAAARAKGVPAVAVIERGVTFFSEDPDGARAFAKATAAANAEGTPGAATGKGIPLSDIVDLDLSVRSERPLEALGAWIVEHAPAKRLSLAENFPFLRHPLAVELGRQNAIQNGAIGLVFFVPGADMPLITLNQVRMVMQIAAVYGYPIDTSRLREVVGVVLGGFGFRAIARRLASQLPVLGWAIKPGVAAAGTIAISYAAIDYFEKDGLLRGAADTLEGVVREVVGIACDASRHGGPAD